MEGEEEQSGQRYSTPAGPREEVPGSGKAGGCRAAVKGSAGCLAGSGVEPRVGLAVFSLGGWVSAVWSRDLGS